MSKQRPNTVLGLTAHAIRLRWENMGKVGRAATIVGALLLGAFSMSAAQCALGGDTCPYADQQSSERPPCSYSE